MLSVYPAPRSTAEQADLCNKATTDTATTDKLNAGGELIATDQNACARAAAVQTDARPHRQRRTAKQLADEVAIEHNTTCLLKQWQALGDAPGACLIVVELANSTYLVLRAKFSE